MENVRTYAALAAILAVFIFHSISLNFTQDDAFISYRYVRNLVAGHGLVFNPGERVEGYTNFMWIILLAVFTRLGLDTILASKILGVTSGCIALVLLYKISRLVLQTQYVRTDGRASTKARGSEPQGSAASSHWLFAAIPPAILASNGAFAYWTISGLETACFIMAVLLSVYCYLSRGRLMAVAAALATLLRPEGALVFAIIVVHSFLTKERSFRNCLVQVLGFTLLVTPFLAFRISYYRDILPNPFYAKTGLSLEYVRAGVTYFWLFLKAYGLWGGLLLAPLLLYRRLRPMEKFILLFVYIYTAYVILVGGDVLRAHRFFLPILPLVYVLFALGIAGLHSFLRIRSEHAASVGTAVLVAALSMMTFLLPRAPIKSAREAEIALYDKMAKHADALTHSFGRDFTLAASTIGAIGYLADVKVIDMLGLTDRYIAKHPERIPGISSTWKEKTFNTRYLLSRNPDVILFSTGIRPSAPAEKALFLSSKFRRNYYPYYFPAIPGTVYKRKGDYPGENVIFADAAFVDLYAETLYLGPVQGDLEKCIEKLGEIIEIGPEDFARAYEYTGTCYYLLGRMRTAEQFARKAVSMDDYCVEAHTVLEKIYLAEGNREAALQEREKVLKYNPERLDSR